MQTCEVKHHWYNSLYIVMHILCGVQMFYLIVCTKNVIRWVILFLIQRIDSNNFEIQVSISLCPYMAAVMGDLSRQKPVSTRNSVFMLHLQFKLMTLFHRRALKCSKFLVDAGFLCNNAAMLTDLVKWMSCKRVQSSGIWLCVDWCICHSVWDHYFAYTFRVVQEETVYMTSYPRTLECSSVPLLESQILRLVNAV